MKKTIAILLLTALCLTVLTSCDFSGGLVAELFGDIKDVPVGEHIYPTDEYIPIETDIIMDIDPPVSYDEPDCGLPDMIALENSIIDKIENEFLYDTEVTAYGKDIQKIFEGTDGILLKQNQIAIKFCGSAAFTGGSQPDVEFGYSINSEDPVFDASFNTGRKTTNLFGEAIGVVIRIPVEEFKDGYNVVELLAKISNDTYVNVLSTVMVFKEVPTTHGEDETCDVSYDAVDTVEPAVEETVEECTTEIEYAAPDFDD